MNTMFVRGLAVTGLMAAAGTASAAIQTLQDLNSTVRINDSAQAGMSDWIVDGTDHLFQQWFWFRIQGDTQERSLDTLPLLGTQLVDTNAFTDNRADTFAALYGNGQITFQPTWTLRGGTAGSGVSDVTESVVITNVSNSAFTLNFFQYTDFDLNGTAGGDSGQFMAPLFNTVQQSDGSVSLGETVITPAPAFFEVSTWPTILNRLNNGTVEDLANNAGPVGPADLAWAVQWTFTIQAGQSVVIAKDKSIVPAPGALALVAIGGLVAVRRRR